MVRIDSGRSALHLDPHTEEKGARMNMDDEEYSPFGGYGGGCDLHGEDFLRECTMCGIEFCSACFPRGGRPFLNICANCKNPCEYKIKPL